MGRTASAKRVEQDRDGRRPHAARVVALELRQQLSRARGAAAGVGAAGPRGAHVQHRGDELHFLEVAVTGKLADEALAEVELRAQQRRVARERLQRVVAEAVVERSVEVTVDRFVGEPAVRIELERGLVVADRRRIAAKLEQLRDDIRQGLNSGPSKAWNVEDVKREGRAWRARKVA